MIQIRSVQLSDLPAVMEMIRELAEFEKLTHMLVTTEQDLQRVLIDESHGPEALVASVDQELVGYAIYFENFSSFLCRPGIYLEDVYVRPTHRKRGVGKSFIKQLAQIARDRDCGRMEWAVLDWNENAIDFYRSLGGQILDEWRIVRVDRDAIEKLAE